METNTILTPEDSRAIVEYMNGANELIAQMARAEITDQNTFTKGGDLGKIVSARLKKLDEDRLETTKKPHQYVDWINAEFKKITDPLIKALGSGKNPAPESLRSKMTAWAAEEKARKDEEEKERRDKEDAKALAAAEAQENAAKEAEAAAARARAAVLSAEDRGEDLEAGIAQRNADAADAAAETYQQKADEILNKAADRPVADTRVQKARGDLGSVSSIKKVWAVDLVDLSELPKGYLHMIQTSPKAVTAILAVIKPLTDAAIKSDEQIPGLNFFQKDQLQIR